MKSIMLSVKPKYVEKILNGEKSIEIRKTKPSCELPIKVYIYCTKSKPYLYRINDDDEFELTNKLGFEEDCFVKHYGNENAKVVAEFTLNKVKGTCGWRLKGETGICTPIKQWEKELPQKACLTIKEIINYSGSEKYEIFAWHIDNLIIYDKPKELSDFKTTICCPNMTNVRSTENIFGNWVSHYEENFICRRCKKYDGDFNICLRNGFNSLTKAPKSWCYIEE